MVLEFINIVTLIGGSEDLRKQCIQELQDYGSFRCERIPDLDNSTKFNVETSHAPLDNALLDLAPKYLALDFTVVFKPKSDTLLKDWRGCIRVVDQMMYFSDNYEAAEGYELGSIYELKNKGGFPECLADFQS